MTTPLQGHLAPIQIHNNQQLFSDYYLDTILSKRDDWKALAGQAATVMQEVKNLLDAFQHSSNEAQTEDNLIKPVLTALGHIYEIQAQLRTGGNTQQKPDYIFYQNQASKNANSGKVLTDELPQQGAYAVGDAKRWDRPLDQATKTEKGKRDESFSNKNPSYQIAFYIQHSSLDWGILTNGRKWRLYHKSTAHKLDRFYEVDLPELVESGDPLRFLYFYAFFRRAAFEPQPLGLDSILQASAEYARGVGDTLKSQVYEALRHIAQGFLDHPSNTLPNDAATMKKIYDASLILLYRLLFILYAEDRQLLPINASKDYKESYSLRAIRREVASNLDAGRRLRANSALLWPRLTELFRIINEGDPPLKVATFNGGLFDSEKHPFLEENTVGDARLQKALDKLSRVDGQFVDFRDLAVRHLGTIYEGLLEYHLEPLQDGGEWSVDLLNDKGERKATGSYYTPDYIVKYIVEQTLQPVIDAVIEEKDPGWNDEWTNAILSINVLDPAMGSGHFLVEATEYIARFLVEMGIRPPDAEGSPDTDMAYWKRRVVQSCIYGVDLNPLAVELAKLSLWLATVAKDKPLSFLDHHLRCGNSLIGSRISDLQWGNRLSAGQKRARKAAKQAIEAGQQTIMNFDAFHQSMSIAVDSMWLIEENPGQTIADVKEQEQIYNSLRESLVRKYKRLMDLVTATHFGVNVDPSLWLSLASYTTGGGGFFTPKYEEWLGAADKLAEDQRFFHWELEFPEVYFNRQGQSLGDTGGFDAVIGNPPYFTLDNRVLERLNSYFQKDTFWSEHFRGKGDILYMFIIQALRLAHVKSICSMIVSRYWPTAKYADKLREFILKKCTIREIIDFNKYLVFSTEDGPVNIHTGIFAFEIDRDRDAKATNVFRVQNVLAKNDVTLASLMSDIEQRQTNSVHIEQMKVKQASLGSSRWVFANTSTDSVLNKIKRATVALGELCYTGEGIKTGNDDVFASLMKSNSGYTNPLDVHPQEFEFEPDIVRPVISSNDEIDRYSLTPIGRHILYVKRDLEISQYPLLQEYLERYRYNLNELAKPSGKSSPLSERYTVKYEGLAWYSLVRYNELLFNANENLFCRYRNARPSFVYSSTGLCSLTNITGISPKGLGRYNLKYILAILNSGITPFYMRHQGKTKGSVYEFRTDTLAPFPIRSINFTTEETERQAFSVESRQLYASGLTEQAYGGVLSCVSHHLSQKPERADIIHDLLSYLAQQMIDLNKHRQSAVEDLVLDLEGRLPITALQKIVTLWTPPSNNTAPPADAITQLGSLANTRLELRDDIGRITEDQWKWLLRGRLRRVENLADLVKVYRQRQPAIAELDRKIAFTDSLIDQIVYKLYGLTDEEIAIVEGKSKVEEANLIGDLSVQQFHLDE